MKIVDVPIVLLGADNVGKSALTVMFIQGHFVEPYDATIEDIYRKPLQEQRLTLTVVDTAGQEAFAQLRQPYLRTGQCFILVYDVTSPASVEKMMHISKELDEVRDRAGGPGPYKAAIVVGCKKDLLNAPEKSDAVAMARDFAAGKNLPHLLVSAKNREEVNSMFDAVVNDWLAATKHDPNKAGFVDAVADALMVSAPKR